MSYAEPDTDSLDAIQMRDPRARRQGRGGIERALDDLDKGLSMLAEQVERADMTLGPILGPATPQPADAALTEVAERSAVAERIDGAAARAATLARALRERLDRVDL
jgi:hypothetical protein